MTLALISGLLERVADGLALTVVGMGVVFVALALLMMMITGLNRVRVRREAKALAPKAAASVAETALDAASADDKAISPRLVAVISAAVAAALGPGTRVHRVRFVGPGGRGQWAASGRAGIMGSHRPQLHRGSRPRGG